MPSNDEWANDNQDKPGCCNCLCKFFWNVIFVFPWTSIAFCVALVICESMLLDRVKDVAKELQEYAGFELDETHVTWVLFGVIAVNAFSVIMAIFATPCSAFCQTHCACLKDDDDENCRNCANYSFAFFINIWSLITFIVHIAAVIQAMLLTAIFIIIFFSSSVCTVGVAAQAGLRDSLQEILNQMITEMNEASKSVPETGATFNLNIGPFCDSMADMTGWVAEAMALSAAVAILQGGMFGVSRANYREQQMMAKHDIAKTNNDKISAV